MSISAWPTHVWCIPHVVNSAQELAVAGGVGRLTASHFTVGATQLQGMPSNPGGFWVLTTTIPAACNTTTVAS